VQFYAATGANWLLLAGLGRLFRFRLRCVAKHGFQRAHGNSRALLAAGNDGDWAQSHG